MYFQKRVAPPLVIGLLCLPAVVLPFSGLLRNLQLVVIAMPLIGAGLVYFLFKKMVFDLADEVFDCGDHLLVRRDDLESTVALSNIMNVSESYFTKPPRVTLRLREPGVFGREIAFTPTHKAVFNPFARNTVVDDLIERIDRTRRFT